METPDTHQIARMEAANRLFFRLYQCANLLQKTGSRAVESEGLTTQQWGVLGALSHPNKQGGVSINELARYLKVSRQNLTGVLGCLERDGHICAIADKNDRRSRLIQMTGSGRDIWTMQATPKIHAFYNQALSDFSMDDITHTLHYLLKLLENMDQLDNSSGHNEPEPVNAP
jgi:DNA-binding MarR family transcriptional regulator